MKLTIVSQGDDWYTIERANHTNEYGGRIGDACVEGTSEEMLELARGILAGEEHVRFRRCAFHRIGDVFEFYSPRNTMNRGPDISLEHAVELAHQIVETLKQEAST